MFSVRTKIIEKDRGKKALEKKLLALSEKPGVKVGILAEDASKTKETRAETARKVPTLLDVAIWNEFGVDKETKNGRRIKIPERSFIRATVAREKGNWQKYQAQLFRDLLTEKNGMTVEKAIGLLGERIQKDIQRAFVDPGWPDKPDAPSTVARKGSSQPLIDTGQLRRSIRWKSAGGGEK